jgi:pimeloyl-ACP methyl ester carboxylesterase
MSAITIGGELIHYEVLGRGRPVLLLHSWVGSWRYWVPTMQNLQLKYRVYALDLHGFGDTGKNPQKYSIDNQTQLIVDFMNVMAIPKAAIIGHGLGAWVAAEFSRRNQEKAPRIMLISAPLFNIPNLDKRPHPGRATALTNNRSEAINDLTIMNSKTMQAALQERLRAAQAGADHSVSTSAPAAVGTADKEPHYNPLQNTIGSSTPESLLQKCFKRSDPIYDKLAVDMPKTDAKAYAAVNEFDAGRMLDTVWQLEMPTVILHGSDDPIIEPPNEAVWNHLTDQHDDNLMPIPLQGVRHFPMLEYERFLRLANDFLESPDISKLEIKERWKRRSR